MSAVTLSGLLAVALGGALGSMGRFGVSAWMGARLGETHIFGLGSGFPWGTLSVNVLGSFIIGWVWVVWQSRYPQAEHLRLFLMVGLLGGFTTFSAFSLETLQLLDAGLLGRALVYVLASVLLCLLGVWLGVSTGKWTV